MKKKKNTLISSMFNKEILTIGKKNTQVENKNIKAYLYPDNMVFYVKVPKNLPDT